jgi:hypothetical protein
MREVVTFFDQSSRGNTRSPAYLQLQRTIAEIQAVIEELEGNDYGAAIWMRSARQTR